MAPVVRFAAAVFVPAALAVPIFAVSVVAVPVFPTPRPGGGLPGLRPSVGLRARAAALGPRSRSGLPAHRASQATAAPVAATGHSTSPATPHPGARVDEHARPRGDTA